MPLMSFARVDGLADWDYGRRARDARLDYKSVEGPARAAAPLGPAAAVGGAALGARVSVAPVPAGLGPRLVSMARVDVGEARGAGRIG